MKTFYFGLLVSIIITTVLASCSSTNNVVGNNLIQKRKYSKGWHLKNKSNISAIKKSTDYKTKGSYSTAGIPEIKKIKTIETVNKDETGLVASNNNELVLNNNKDSKISLIIKPISIKDSNNCSEIIQRDGEIIKALVLEIGVSEIKYKKCNNEDGPIYSIKKSDVFMIKYNNGETDVFKEDPKVKEKVLYEGEQQIEITGIIGFIIGIASIFVLLFASWFIGGLLGIIPLILGIVSLNRIKNGNGKYKSKAFAIASLILGIGLLAFTATMLIIRYI